MVKGSDGSKKGSRQAHPNGQRDQKARVLGDVWTRCSGVMLSTPCVPSSPGLQDLMNWSLESVSSQMMEVVRTE